jgi:hypothetical protein
MALLRRVDTKLNSKVNLEEQGMPVSVGVSSMPPKTGLGQEYQEAPIRDKLCGSSCVLMKTALRSRML